VALLWQRESSEFFHRSVPALSASQYVCEDGVAPDPVFLKVSDDIALKVDQAVKAQGSFRATSHMGVFVCHQIAASGWSKPPIPPPSVASVIVVKVRTEDDICGRFRH